MVRRLPPPAVGNPFRHRIEWTWPLVLKVALGAVFLLPIRAVLMILSLLILWPVCWIGYAGWEPGSGNHFKPWQQWIILNIAMPIDRFMMFCVGYTWVRHKGRRATPEEAPVTVIAPHATIGDGTLIPFTAFGSPVSRVANIEMPAFRPLLCATEPIIVNRKDKGSRHAVIDEIKKRLASPGRWTSIVFFPEGTCGNTKALLGFKGGPFYPGCPVQPVIFRNLCPQGWTIWTFLSFNFFQALVLTMCQLNNPIEAEYLPVYHPSEEEKKDPFLFAANVQAVMARSLGVPATNFTYEDADLMMQAIKKGLPEDAGLVEFQLLRPIVGMNMAEMSDQLNRFISMDTNKDGFLTVEEMQAFFSWPVDNHVECFFCEYDTSSRGKITFREFLLGLAELSRAVPNTEHLCEEAFKMFSSSSGLITVQSLRSAFHSNEHAISENQASLLFAKMSREDDTVDQKTFIQWVTINPEYQVFFQWFVHGVNSFPEAIKTPDDETDKRLLNTSCER